MQSKASAIDMTSGWFNKTLTRLAKHDRAPTPALSADAAAIEMRSIKALMIAGQLEEAEARLRILARSNRDYAGVLAHLGATIYLRGDQPGAMPILAEAFAAQPEDAFAAKFLAACLAAESSDDAAISVARRATLLNPADAEVFSVAASVAIKRGEFDEAARYLNRALEIQPDAIKPLEQLESLSVISTWRRGIYEASPKIEQARRRAINRMLAAHRKHPLDIEQLAVLLALLEGGDAESFATAAKIAAQSRDLEGANVTLSSQLASIFWVQGEGEEMLRQRNRALQLDRGNRTLALGLSHAQLMQGDGTWKDAWKTMTDALFHLRPDLHPPGATLWTGQRLGGKPLLVYQDQGIGDAIVGLRLLQTLKDRGIAYRLWVLPALADFAAGVPGGEHLMRAERLPSAADAGCTFACPLFGLISALNLSPEEVRNAPLFRVAPTQSPALRADVRALASPRIGLMLGANPVRRDDWLRSLPVDVTPAFARLDGVSWVNLMIDERPLRGTLAKRLALHDPMPKVSSFADTAAVIDELDAVVAVDSSTAHLAAALGKKIWVLAPSMLDWRWQSGSLTSPWWPGAQLLRADAPGVWTGTVSRLIEEVGAYVKEIRNPAMHQKASRDA